VVGLEQTEVVSDGVKSEHVTNGDILLVNLTDKYEQLTLTGSHSLPFSSWHHLIHKWLATLHFHSNYCSTVPHLVITDMDTVVFVDRLVALLPEMNNGLQLGCVVGHFLR
jgi:hypothetical protein